MPSRRDIRESVVQFLYCADLEGGADPTALRPAFWEFVTESDRRKLLLATYRTIHHLAHGREGRIVEFDKRRKSADETLAAWPEAEPVRTSLKRLATLEDRWSTLLDQMERLPRDENESQVVDQFSRALDGFFKLDHDLATARHRFLEEIEDHPEWRGRLESVAASIRRLQRISDRLRMVEQPELFPDQADLSRLRDSKTHLEELRTSADQLADQILAGKEQIDTLIAGVVENFAPERIDPVDRAILRLATHEIMTGNAPSKVAINEAVELAKRFGTSDSGRFVNGVLDRIAGRQQAGNGSS